MLKKIYPDRGIQVKNMGNKIKPTRLQKATVAIIAADRKKRISQAMIEAGYSKKTSEKPKQNFTSLKGTAIAIEEYRDKLRGAGITEDALVAKYVELFNATKVKTSLTEPDQIVPNHEIQVKILPDIRRDLGLPTDNKGVEVNIDNRTQVINLPEEEVKEFIKWRDEQRRKRLSQPTTKRSE